jgi:hypothetical protein
MQNKKTRLGTINSVAIDSGVGRWPSSALQRLELNHFPARFCGHGSDKTSDGTSTSEHLPELHPADEIHEVDPTWAVSARTVRFSLPALRRGQDQRGQAGCLNWL